MRSDKADISNCHPDAIDYMHLGNCIGKGGVLNRGLKIIKQLIRVLECILEKHVRQRVEIDEMQCRFMSGHGDTPVLVFILSQL